MIIYCITLYEHTLNLALVWVLDCLPSNYLEAASGGLHLPRLHTWDPLPEHLSQPRAHTPAPINVFKSKDLVKYLVATHAEAK